MAPRGFGGGRDTAVVLRSYAQMVWHLLSDCPRTP